MMSDEQIFTEPELVHPLDNGWYFQGFLDLMKSGVLVDYKGVSNTREWSDARGINFQVELYQLAAARQLGVDINKVEYRLITRPTLQFSPGKDGGDLAVYEKRCLDWLLGDPEKLVKVPVAVNKASLRNAEDWINQVCVQIDRCREDGFWLTNSGSCWNYRVPCEYLPLCKAQKMGKDLGPVLEKYGPREGSRPSNFKLDPKKRISYSAASTFMECPAKYYWASERRISRQGGMKSEPLTVGHLIHDALEICTHENLDAGLSYINDWQQKQMCLTEEDKTTYGTWAAKSRAMVMAAKEKWG